MTRIVSGIDREIGTNCCLMPYLAALVRSPRFPPLCGLLKSLIDAGSFFLGCGLRAGVNLVVLFLRVNKKKGILGKAILHAIFGEDTFRFGGMLGAFTFL
jgi:hypothetical protein